MTVLHQGKLNRYFLLVLFYFLEPAPPMRLQTSTRIAS